MIATAISDLAAAGYEVVVIQERDRAQPGPVLLGSGQGADVLAPVTLDEADAPAAGLLRDLGYAVVLYGSGDVDGGRRQSSGPDGGSVAEVGVDLAAARLAVELGADALVIAADESRVVLDSDTDRERPLGQVLQRHLHAYLEAGEFEGSAMESRLLALLWFIERAGNHATICDLGSIVEAAQGTAVGVIVAADDEVDEPDELDELDDDW